MTRAIFVVDTNVVVSGMITADPESPPDRILTLMIDGRLLYLMSGALFTEYSEVLGRPGVARLHRRTDDEIDRLLMVLAANGMWRRPAAAVSAPDSGDDHLWALLASWSGSRLITGDKRLLNSPSGPGAVLTPREAAGLMGPS